MKSIFFPNLRWFLQLFVIVACTAGAFAANSAHEPQTAFPIPLGDYADQGVTSLGQKLLGRIQSDPFNLVATVIFFLAIIHTFAASKFLAIGHKFAHEHEALLQQKAPDGPESASYFSKVE